MLLWSSSSRPFVAAFFIEFLLIRLICSHSTPVRHPCYEYNACRDLQTRSTSPSTGHVSVSLNKNYICVDPILLTLETPNKTPHDCESDEMLRRRASPKNNKDRKKGPEG